jgi:hypothetical protein
MFVLRTGPTRRTQIQPTQRKATTPTFGRQATTTTTTTTTNTTTTTTTDDDEISRIKKQNKTVSATQPPSAVSPVQDSLEDRQTGIGQHNTTIRESRDNELSEESRKTPITR